MADTDKLRLEVAVLTLTDLHNIVARADGLSASNHAAWLAALDAGIQAEAELAALKARMGEAQIVEVDALGSEVWLSNEYCGKCVRLVVEE